MKLTLITTLLGLGMAATSPAAEAFRVYAPSSKTHTLWIVEALPREDGGLELKVDEKRDLGFNGRIIAAHPKKPLLYIAGGGGERGKVPGAVVTLAQNGSYASHQPVDLNDDAAYLSLDRSGAFLFGVSYGMGRTATRDHGAFTDHHRRTRQTSRHRGGQDTARCHLPPSGQRRLGAAARQHRVADPETAAALAQHKGRLHLTGLVKLSPETRAALQGHANLLLPRPLPPGME